MYKANQSKETDNKMSGETQMRNATIRVSATNIANKDNPDLGVSAGGIISYSLTDIVSTLEDWIKTKHFSYYAVAHDEGTDNEHFHIVLDFDSNSKGRFHQIKNHFPYGQISNCERGVKTCVQYLVHANDPNKEQLPWEAIVTNNPAKLETYKGKAASSMERWFEHYSDLILTGKIREFEIDKIDPQVYIRYEHQFQAAFNYVKKAYIANPDRDIQIIIVQGASRVGKGIFIKEWAKKQGKSLCFSSSSNDTWQDYKGQDIFVYDDNSFEHMKIQDMIKTFDPYNNTTVKARYKNRVFMGDTIFVTTNIPITDIFPGEEPILREALFRRITCVLDFAEPKGTKTTYTINELSQEGSCWKLNQLGTKTIDLAELIDTEADEKKKKRFIDSLG